MRTKQDNDISLYSLAEIETMTRIRQNKNSTSYVPFTLVELHIEWNKRQN